MYIQDIVYNMQFGVRVQWAWHLRETQPKQWHPASR